MCIRDSDSSVGAVAGSHSAAAHTVWTESHSRCGPGIAPGASASVDWLFSGRNLCGHASGDDIGGANQRKCLAAVFIPV